VVRPLCDADTERFEPMWAECRSNLGRFGSDAPTARDLLNRVHECAEQRLVVATVDDEPVGFALFAVAPLTPMHTAAAVHITLLHVRADRRGRGAGHSLVGAASRYAGEIGAEHVVASALPGARESNRFFARLGFGPVVVRRVTSTSALQRRLAAGGTGSEQRLRLMARKRSVGRGLSPVHGPASRALGQMAGRVNAEVAARRVRSTAPGA
jgi:GNAT superfamily N-acetyltransferase